MPEGYSAAIVTGASSGIGRAIAMRLRGDGLAVRAVGRSRGPLDALAAECGAEPVVLDVRETARLPSLFDGMAVDVLVCNAGILPVSAPFQAITPDDLDAMLDVNLKAPLHLARLALPGMIARRRGHLFFIGSSAGRWPHPNAAVYGASKAGLSLFCDALRCDLLGTGIRVTEIAPGRVETALYRDALGRERAAAELYDGYAPVAPAEVAEILAAALALPPHVDVSRIEVFPTAQAVGGARMVKGSEG
jgi:NADP-dependent 3-hydroxy acid dehydrogenase YdfG